MILRLLLIVLFCMLPHMAASAEHKIDSETGQDYKTIKDFSDHANVQVGDKISKKHSIVWDDIKDDEGNKISVIRGTTQHHHISGTLWRTVIDIEGKRFKGTSNHTNGDWSMTIEEVEG